MTDVSSPHAPLTIPDFDDVVVLVAHPDDETLGCGGLLHAVQRPGRPVTVVLASNGEAADPDLDVDGRRALGQTRVQESERAITTLAPEARIVRLELPDSAVENHGDVLAGTLHALCTSETLLVSHHPNDLHPDHEAVGRAASASAARTGCAHLAFGIWMWEWPRDDTQYEWDRARSYTVDHDGRRAKHAAMSHYLSQTDDRTGAGPVVTGSMLDALLGPLETYFVGART